MKSSRIVTLLGAVGFFLAAGAATAQSKMELNAAFAAEDKKAEVAMKALKQANFDAALPARLALVNSVIDQFRAEFAIDENGMKRLSEFAAQVHATPSRVLNEARFARNVADFAGQTERILAKPTAIRADALGDAENLVFFPIGPCRIADSRFSTAGVLTNGVIRTYRNFSSSGQGGTAGCNTGFPQLISGTPGSIALNIAGTSITGTGNLNVRPAGSSIVTSSLNFTPGQDISNATVIKMTGAVPDFEILPTVNGSPGTVHVVIDLLGFYVPSEPAPLECQESPQNQGTGTLAVGGSQSVNAPACQAGFSQTGLSCFYNGTAPVGFQVSELAIGFYCVFQNTSGAAVTGSNLWARTRCCRVPGNSTGRL